MLHKSQVRKHKSCMGCLWHMSAHFPNHSGSAAKTTSQGALLLNFCLVAPVFPFVRALSIHVLAPCRWWCCWRDTVALATCQGARFCNVWLVTLVLPLSW